MQLQPIDRPVELAASPPALCYVTLTMGIPALKAGIRHNHHSLGLEKQATLGDGWRLPPPEGSVHRLGNLPPMGGSGMQLMTPLE